MKEYQIWKCFIYVAIRIIHFSGLVAFSLFYLHLLHIFILYMKKNSSFVSKISSLNDESIEYMFN